MVNPMCWRGLSPFVYQRWFNDNWLHIWMPQNNRKLWIFGNVQILDVYSEAQRYTPSLPFHHYFYHPCLTKHVCTAQAFWLHTLTRLLSQPSLEKPMIRASKQQTCSERARKRRVRLCSFRHSSKGHFHLESIAFLSLGCELRWHFQIQKENCVGRIFFTFYRFYPKA